MKDYTRPIPVGDKILLEVDREDHAQTVKSNVIQIVQSEDTKLSHLLGTKKGKILSFGRQALETGLLTSDVDELQPGQYVLFVQNAGTTIDQHTNKDKLFRLVKRGDIMAILGESDHE